MYKTDLITSEIEKLAQVLAKIMGLKLEGSLAPAELLFEQTLESAFSLPPNILNTENIDIFKTWLHTIGLPADKLDSLSEFLYYELGVSLERNKQLAPKLNLIYQMLAEKFKIVHLVNFHRQETIKQYL